MDLYRTKAGKPEINDRVAAAKIRVTKALNNLGQGMQSSCMWSTVGLGVTLEGWTEIVRRNGQSMNADKAGGIFLGALESLAIFYGMINKGKLGAMGQQRAYQRGWKDAIDYISVFATTAQGGEKAVVGRLLAGLEKRFSRFA